jgi:hypothetical protein
LELPLNYQRIAFIGALLGVTFILLEPKLAGSRDGSFAVNGQKLHIELLGTFAPTVVFEAGLGNDSATWKSLVRRCVGEREQLTQRTLTAVWPTPPRAAT